jgi:hypothetical protein
VARSRDSLFLIAALGIHAAGLLSAGVIARFKSHRDPGASLPAHIEGEIPSFEIDLLPEEPASAPERPAPVGVAAAARAPDLRGKPSEPRRREPRAAQPEAEPDIAPAPAESASAPDPGWLPNEEPERAPGLNGAPIWTLPGVLTAPSAAGTKPLAPRRADAAPPSQNPSEEQKQAALLPSAGTLASAVAEEVAASSAPLTSESHFKLTLDGQGRLVSALFLSANGGDRAGWERIARAVAKRFAGKSMPMPASYAGGGTVFVTIRSRVTMPDGSAHGTPTPRSIDEKAPDNEYGRIDSPLNDRFRSPGKGTSPAPNTIVIGVPFVFDIANLGATRRRVVHAQVRAVPASP